MSEANPVMDHCRAAGGRVRDLVRRVLENRFPSACGAFIFGSALSSAETASDIDLIVIDESSALPYHEHFHLSQWIFDIYVYSERDFISEMERQRKRSNDYFAEAVLGGSAVCASEDSLDRIRIAASHAMATRAPNDVANYRLPLATLIREVTEQNDGILATVARAELLSVVLCAERALQDGSIGALKYMAERLSETKSGGLSELERSMALASLGRPGALIDYASRVLIACGGGPDNHVRIYLPRS